MLVHLNAVVVHPNAVVVHPRCDGAPAQASVIRMLCSVARRYHYDRLNTVMGSLHRVGSLLP